MNAQTAPSFDPLAKTLHWFVALTILFMLPLGAFLSDGAEAIDPAWRTPLFTAHKTIGILILFATLFRLYWRQNHKSPRWPRMPHWQFVTAKLVHSLLYVLTVLIPLSGWVLVSMGPYGIKLFGVIPFPSIPFLQDLEDVDSIREIMGEVHGGLASFLAVLIVLHIGGTLMHHFVDRDDVFLRIAPVWSHRFLNRLRGF